MSVKDFEDKRWRNSPQKLEFRHQACLSLVTSGSVLDIGCGDGLLLAKFKEQGIEGAGVDVSPEAVRRCVQKGLHANEHSLDEPLPFPTEAFDTVVLLDVLEHVYEPERVLAEACRVAARRVIIGVPNFSSFPARLQVLAGRVPENNRPQKAHVYWFNWSVLSVLTASAALRPLEVRMNTFWERIPGIGSVTRAFARMSPNLFALSFVVSYEKNV